MQIGQSETPNIDFRERQRWKAGPERKRSTRHRKSVPEKISTPSSHEFVL